MLNDGEYNYCFMNNSKYNYIAVTKPNALLATFLSKHDRDRFCLNCFGNFQTDEKLEHQKSCRDHNHAELEIPQKVKIIFNKDKVDGSMLKHSLLNTSLQPPFIVVYDFEPMTVETDNQSKLGELRKNEDELFTIKTGECYVKT